MINHPYHGTAVRDTLLHALKMPGTQLGALLLFSQHYSSCSCHNRKRWKEHESSQPRLFNYYFYSRSSSFEIEANHLHPSVSVLLNRFGRIHFYCCVLNKEKVTCRKTKDERSWIFHCHRRELQIKQEWTLWYWIELSDVDTNSRCILFLLLAKITYLLA